jgi:hypothetical protein
MKLTIIGPFYPYHGGIAHFTTMLTQNLIELGYEIIDCYIISSPSNWKYYEK